jgi:hypothetical protein
MTPIHIEGPVTPVVAWMKKVNQRKAPGAINAMALLVSPVRPSVFFISTAGVSAMYSSRGMEPMLDSLVVNQVDA